MTRDRDIERVLETWLAPGPTVMPDRLFDGVLERIERQPQRRLARLQLRFTTMRPITILAAAAAITIAVGAGIVLLGRPSTPDVAAPTAAPTVAPVPTASAAPSPSPVAGLPEELAHIWIGAPRVTSLGGGQPRLLALDFDPTTGIGPYATVIVDLGSPVLASEATVPSAGRLRSEIAIGSGGCGTGDLGEYTYTLSPDGMTLELSTLEDACAPRAEVYAGTWTRSDCRNPDDFCLGAVPAGTYVSTFFDARSAPGREPSRGAYGQLRYAVPDGWANMDDWPDDYSLIPAADYAGDLGAPTDNQTAWHAVYVKPRPARVGPGTCVTAADPTAPTTASDLAAYIASHPALEATAPAPVAVAPLTGTMVDIRLRADWTGTCPELAGDAPTAPLLAERAGAAGPWDWGVVRDERQRLIFVDIGGGATVMIAIDDNASPSRFDELVAAAMPVIATFEFPEPE